jgi:hypothetical protein
MPLTPDYGETPLPHDELSALLGEVVDILDKPITRASVYDLEQGFQNRVSEELMPAAMRAPYRSMSFSATISCVVFTPCSTALSGPGPAG